MIELRPYQVRFVREVHDALRRKRAVVAVAPTGSGKRIVACWWATKIVERGKRLLVVTNRRTLVRQMADECKQHQIRYGIIMATEARDDEAMVQVASIQTIKRRQWMDMPEADWVIVDEAHNEEAAYQTLISRYPAAKIVGLTATPVGSNGRSLIGTWDEIVEPIRNTELIQAGWLLRTQVMCPCEPDIDGVVLKTKTGQEVKGVPVSGSGEYNQSLLAQAVEQCIVFANVFEWWRPYSDMQTIVFAPRVKFAEGICLQFKERGHLAEIITANTELNERKKIFERFTNREIRVLVSIDCLREGYDSPIVQCGIDLQPNYQLRTFWQKVGRIKRPYEGQDTAVWLDFAGNFWRHIHPDEDPEWPQDQTTTTRELVNKKKEKAEKEPWSCPSCSYTLSPWERPTKLDDGNLACPNCGKVMLRAIRRIVMANGQMRTVSAKQRKKRKEQDAIRTWFQCLYPAIYAGKTLDFARWLYHQRTGKWPNETELATQLKGRMAIPEPSSGLWKRLARHAYPFLAKRRRK